MYMHGAIELLAVKIYVEIGSFTIIVKYYICKCTDEAQLG